MADQLQIAKLDEGEVTKVRELESNIGAHVMAFERGKKLAKLDENELARVKALEDELDVTLLVYQD